MQSNTIFNLAVGFIAFIAIGTLLFYSNLVPKKHSVTELTKMPVVETQEAVKEAQGLVSKEDKISISETVPVPSNGVVSYIVSPDTLSVDQVAYFFTDNQTIKIPLSSIQDYKWNFGDGTTAVGARAQYIYKNAGQFTVTLIVTDLEGKSYSSVQEVRIENKEAPTVVITAKDMQPIYEVSGKQKFNWNTFPIEIQFDLHRSKVQGMGLKDAHWDFGDGGEGFGLSPTYIYHKPGQYMVKVTARDELGLQGHSSMEVNIGKDNCSDTDGVEGCLKLENAIGNTLPMSAGSWFVGHDFGHQQWKLKRDEKNFAFLKVTDDTSNLDYDISSAIAANGNQLEIRKSDLEALGVNFKQEYSLNIAASLDDDSEYNGMFPNLRFGIGTVDLTTNESDIKLEVVGSRSYKKYLYMTNATTAQLRDLPVGVYSLIATKGSKIKTFTFEIKDSTPQRLMVEL
ncbi:PKD domain-containing protein [Pseudobdellovibrio exovorus]|uniref:PKD domain-containing protein n=1 Tax=Pseudobdellovibrio exovorus JSS TaxID=1184267 RepID=M4V9Y1_9BACT|nr:PKD domain-containing protein [Pseudobdellovibrio exovorus]AGH96212.1 hypothetical protein A11Q_1996 [Pseudobdellovibrio exovorus JSS]